MSAIFSDLARLPAVADHRPWPRYQVDAATWVALSRALGEGAADLLGLWAAGDEVHLALHSGAHAPMLIASIAVADGQYPSVGQHHPGALRFERAIRDLHGIEPVGLPDARPWLDHGSWGIRAPLGAHAAAEFRDPADYEFLPVHGEGLHQIPVGPVHAGIIEPGHFRFQCAGDVTLSLEAEITAAQVRV